MNDAKPILEVEHLSKHFGAVRALSDFPMAIHPCEVAALAGDDGAGKVNAGPLLARCHRGQNHLRADRPDAAPLQRGPRQ